MNGGMSGGMSRKKADEGTRIKKCPLIKVTRKIVTYDSNGRPIEETITEELNNCCKHFCMAWKVATQRCSYFEDLTDGAEGGGDG